ncbi:tetratricopeptide repeat protein [Fusobacterium animalis]|uniref:tetratricopeptide repeat protein n=1 Tax=Fusobacterium animalis TaxID=76859 RepID=UPI0030D180B9
MIQPKFSFNKKNFEIKELFIDREKAKELYREKLNNNKKDYNILVYYGIGGIGKSSLRKEICRIHEEENRESLCFYLDLNSADDRNLGSGILKLVDSCNKKVDFTCFRLAYTMYFRERNPGIQASSNQKSITDNAFINVGLNILGLFDGGISSTTVDIIERVLNGLKERNIDPSVKEELEKFENYSANEMEERLPLFFQYDLESYIQKHKETKILIVFDTFEAINEGIIEPEHKRRNERWVQDIISYFCREKFKNLITLIFGREKIIWDDYEDIIEQYKLEEFDYKYSEKYLKKLGILEEDIIKKIIKGSEGYPFLLTLSAETYAQIKNKGEKPKISDFDVGTTKIIERFVYNLEKDCVELLRVMSIPNFYNKSIFEYFLNKNILKISMTEFEEFNSSSFITVDDLEKEKDFYIHRILRKEMLKNISLERKKDLNKEFLLYYTDKIDEYAINKNVLEIFYHAKECMNYEEFNKWALLSLSKNIGTPLDILRQLQERGEQSILMHIFTYISQKYEAKEMLRDFINIYIDIVHLGGEYEKSVEICENYLEKYTKSEIVNDKQLLKMSIRKIHHSMFFMPVNELIKKAKNLLEDIDKKQYIDEYNEVLFLLGGNLGILSGNFQEAYKWISLSMEWAEQHKREHFMHRTIRKKAALMLFNNDYNTAMELVTSIISINTPIDKIDTRYKIYLFGILGEIYRKQGDLNNAYYCFDIMEKKSTENHLLGWKAHSYLGKGMIKINKGKYDEGKLLLDMALKIYEDSKHKWGIINVNQAIFYMNKIQGLDTLNFNTYKEEAEKMGYNYNINFANDLENKKNPYLQLFFL